jgi:hypothetical protein
MCSSEFSLPALRNLVTDEQINITQDRDGHGLGPSMGWVGLGWVEFSSTCDGLGWVGLNNRYCDFLHCILC